MNSRVHHIGVGGVCALLFALAVCKSLQTSAREGPQPVPAAVPEDRPRERSVQVASQDQELTRVRELSRMENEQRRRNQAAARMKSAREDVRFSALSRWNNLITTNAPAFAVLSRKAAETRTGETQCTLCDGRGIMHSCVLCENHAGKCRTCNGSGKLSDDEYCPTCVGTGNCFLCGGTGKMTCPFCDDGVISVKRPIAIGVMPID